MDRNKLNRFDDLLTTYSSVRHKYYSKRQSYAASILESTLLNAEESRRNITEFSDSLIDEFVSVKRTADKLSKETSFGLNVFKQVRLIETTHSYIIGDLLNPYGSHGQSHLFLNLFLDALGIERFSDRDGWVVTAEKGRVDILLKRMSPHSVVIIENKSNNAIDQENQLYRYWHQEIYNTILRKNLPKSYFNEPPERFYQLIYLTPSDWKKPNENSLERPRDYRDYLPSVVPMNTKLLTFESFIVSWLKESLAQVNRENNRLREYINQYIEFWTN